MKNLLLDLIKSNSGFLELRYQKRVKNSFQVQKSRSDVASHAIVEGVGVRALVDGVWGFAATSDLSKTSIQKAINEAQKNAKILVKSKKHKVKIKIGSPRLARGDFVVPGFDEIVKMRLSDKITKVIALEKQLAAESPLIHTARCRYIEYIDEKIILTSDGAAASLKLSCPEILLSAIAEKGGERATSFKGAGIAGGWQTLFAHPTLENLVPETARIAIDLLSAKLPEGGQKTVVLAPAMVGLLCHEAIGHTVEADFVKAGSVAQGKLGQKVASELVTLSDTGCDNFSGHAAGNLPFDDEGILTEDTVIIKDGILVSYLHNRETAEEYGTPPTGNARAWLYNDEPIIRMRNTYIKPGQRSLQSIIEEVEDGYLVENAGSGEADSNGEFMFGTGYVWHIKNGKKAELLRNTTLSGIAFDVLKSVDAVSREFAWDLGTGYCGKIQSAKVDAGGPYIRCKISLGGAQ